MWACLLQASGSPADLNDGSSLVVSGAARGPDPTVNPKEQPIANNLNRLGLTLSAGGEQSPSDTPHAAVRPSAQDPARHPGEMGTVRRPTAGNLLHSTEH